MCQVVCEVNTAVRKKRLSTGILNLIRLKFRAKPDEDGQIFVPRRRTATRLHRRAPYTSSTPRFIFVSARFPSPPRRFVHRAPLPLFYFGRHKRKQQRSFPGFLGQKSSRSFQFKKDIAQGESVKVKLSFLHRVNRSAEPSVTQTFPGGGKCSTGTVDTSSLNMLPSALAQLPDMKDKSIHTHTHTPSGHMHTATAKMEAGVLK